MKKSIVKFCSIVYVCLFLTSCGNVGFGGGYIGGSHTGGGFNSGYSGSQTQNMNYGAKKSSPATMRPYTINGKTYYPQTVSVGYKMRGIASWYGPNFHGKKTSNGEVFNTYAMTAAHKTLPMNTIVRVTNLNNNKSIVVRINDRGPFVNDRIIDLSKAGASGIDMLQKGTAPVLLEVIGFSDKADKNHFTDSKTNKPSQTNEILENNTYYGGNFMVQVGAFKNQNGAIITKNKYEKTHKVKILESSDGLFRVFITGFKSEDEARDTAKLIGVAGAFIIRD